MSDLVAVVPVRGGSKGMPGKNTTALGGVPLWKRAVDQGLEAGAREVLVSTDIREILDAPTDEGVRVVERPVELAGDDVPMGPVLVDLFERALPEYSRVVLLQATSPLRTVEDIRATVALHETGAHDLALTVTEADRGVLKYGRMEGERYVPLADPAFCFTNRQSLPPVMRTNGAVYVFDKGWYLANGGFATDRIGAVVMPAERSFDIDTAEDFARAEELLGRQSA